MSRVFALRAARAGGSFLPLLGIVSLGSICLTVVLLGGLGAMALAPRRAEAKPLPSSAREGKQLFQSAAQHIAKGRIPAPNVTRVFLDLEDVKMNLDEHPHEGFLRVWWERPDRFRLEQRPQRAAAQQVTKLLVGDKLWMQLPGRSWRRANKTANDALAVRQAQADRDRFAELAAFMTLAGLATPKAAFEDRGDITMPPGPLQGSFRLVRRTEPPAVSVPATSPGTDFLFDATNPEQPVLRGVVVPADPKTKSPMELLVFKRWTDGPDSRYPARVEGYRFDSTTRKWQRTLLAFPRMVRVDAPMHVSTFRVP